MSGTAATIVMTTAAAIGRERYARSRSGPAAAAATTSRRDAATAEPRRAALRAESGRETTTGATSGFSRRRPALRAEFSRRRPALRGGRGRRPALRAAVAVAGIRALRAAVAVARIRALRAAVAVAGGGRDDYTPARSRASYRDHPTPNAADCAGAAARPKSEIEVYLASLGMDNQRCRPLSPRWTTSWRRTSSRHYIVEVPEGHYRRPTRSYASVHLSKIFGVARGSMKKERAANSMTGFCQHGDRAAAKPEPP